jgi:hypothetical protein
VYWFHVCFYFYSKLECDFSKSKKKLLCSSYLFTLDSFSPLLRCSDLSRVLSRAYYKTIITRSGLIGAVLGSTRLSEALCLNIKNLSLKVRNSRVCMNEGFMNSLVVVCTEHFYFLCTFIYFIIIFVKALFITLKYFLIYVHFLSL